VAKEQQEELERDQSDLLLQDLVQVLLQWDGSDDPAKRRRARLLRYRYVACASPAQIQQDLDLSHGSYFREWNAALAAVRRELAKRAEHG
jgi:hypothetical protein